MGDKRDPRAWWVDEDPFEKKLRKSHTPSRDDGNWRKPRVHVVHLDSQGRVINSLFGNPFQAPNIRLHTGSIWHFSSTEIRHLIWATAAFTLALALMFDGGILNGLSSQFFTNAVLSLIALAPAFLLHEFAHKFVAKYYGCWAEFRADPAGLRFGIILAAITGFLFMAPGAVMVAGKTTKSQFGKIALAGPVTNISLWVIGYAVLFLLPTISLIDTILFYWLWGNGILAAFNMLPFGPLDGKKILTWSPLIYYTWLTISVGIVYLTVSLI